MAGGGGGGCVHEPNARALRCCGVGMESSGAQKDLNYLNMLLVVVAVVLLMIDNMLKRVLHRGCADTEGCVEETALQKIKSHRVGFDLKLSLLYCSTRTF